VAQDKQHNRVTQDAPQLHIAEVAGAEAVAVHQQHRLAIQLHDSRVLEQGGACRFAERLADQEVAVAVHDENRGAAVAQLTQSLADGTLEGGHAIVANPGFEEVPQNVQRLGATGAAVEQIQKRPGDVRALLFQMQV